MKPRQVTIVGAGLTGPLLALLLARRGFSVTLYERRPDPRAAGAEAGRSINLALSARGIRPLERAGVYGDVEPLLIPMRGRLVHERSGEPVLQPYGQRAGEVNYSVGRAALNRVLTEAAAGAGAELRFAQRCLGLDPAGDRLRLRDERSGRTYETAPGAFIATDGAGSVLRGALASAGAARVRVDPLDHDYKEMTLPGVDGRPPLTPNALHIWPRGGFMLIALPNPDGSFTLTLFLAREGIESFAALAEAPAAERFFAEQFPDLRAHLPQLLADFRHNPEGRLATVHTAGWHLGGKVLLLGDAAHAIVPFHGQGMNAGFEDCAVLDDLLEQCDEWEQLFGAFERQRRPNTEAIARMALENYLEMRDSVRDPHFLRRKQLAFALEKRFPDRFIPRYSMVMFHPEISYLEALRRGRRQLAILEELDSRRAVSGEIDMALAEARVHEQLPAVHSRAIRSFVTRAGRITPAQERALETLWPKYGVDADGMLDLDALFGRRAGRVAEIGFGNGENLLALAQAHPEQDFLGIEVHRPGVGRLLLELEERGLDNVRVICRDAVDVLQRHLAQSSLDEILILFPDPWPKKRHHKRRLIQPAFVGLLAERLKSGGTLRLATDWGPYAEEMLAHLSAEPRLRNLARDGGYVPRPADRQTTRFERRGERLGHEVWDLAFARV